MVVVVGETVVDEASGEWVRWEFPATPLHCHQARAWFKACVAEAWGSASDAGFRAAVAFSELITNGCLHGKGPIAVGVRLVGGALTCEVSDRSTAMPVIRDLDEEATSGRGMLLVDGLVDHWDVRLADPTRSPTHPGKTLTFRVNEPPTA